MILRRFYDDRLAQASYLLGCAATGEALIVDANRDIEQYEAAAAAEKLRITHVTETHIHADYVSGSRELAARTGAKLLLSAEGGSDWQYAFAQSDGAVLLHDGDVFKVGNVRVEAMHTPGHTPEHMTFVVTDGAAADEPMGAFTGDFIFVGDVGRPDLLETAAAIAGTREPSARQLYHSLQRFRARFQDWLQLWPGHGAGSACGKGLGAVPQTTLGYEARFNWAFGAPDEETFVRSVLEGQPEPPRYFATMKRVNRDGPAPLGGLPKPDQLSDERLPGLLERGPVVDTRLAREYGTAHVPGTLNIPIDRAFTTWAGALLPYDEPIYLIAVDAVAANEAARALALIGIDRVDGWLAPSALTAWADAGHELTSVPTLDDDGLAQQLAEGGVALLDIRGRAEFAAGAIPGALNIPLGELQDRLDELPLGEPLVVQCRTDNRSAIAASLLEKLGKPGAVKLIGGFDAWARHGRPVERAEPGVPIG